jgi:diguanylate cyclase
MRSFRNRLLVLLIGLVAATQTVTLFAVLARTGSDIRARAAEHLAAAGSVFGSLLDFRTSQLDSALAVLAGDFGFREAVASGDRATIRSAIENHRDRISADIVLLLDVDGAVVVGTNSSAAAASLRLPELIAGLEQSRGRAKYLLLEGKPYQVVVAAVRAPATIAWVAMGFSLDNALGNELRGIIDVDVSFVAAGEKGEPFVASTLGGGLRREMQSIVGQMRPATRPVTVALGGDPYLTYRINLPAFGGAIDVLLQESLHASLAPYRDLEVTMVIIGGTALALAVLAALLWSRNATRPIERLMQAAKRIEAGDYVEAVQVKGAREFERLALTFNRMQRGIAEREARIVNQAHYDALTGLPSRGFAELHLGKVLDRRTAESSVALILFNVKYFREVNASFGHQVGDEALKEMAHRCLQSIRVRDFVARVGADQFLFILDDCMLADALLRCEELAAPFRQGIQLEQISLRLDVVAGICAAPEHGTTVPELLRRADIALHDAKEQQINMSVYAPGGDDQRRRRLAMSAELRESIDRRQLSLVYQPKVNMRTQRVHSVEALVRWTHPEFGVVPPSEFVALAEHTGFIKALTRWVIGEAIVQLAVWRKRGIDIDIAVNLSASDITDYHLAGDVLEQLSKIDVPAKALVFELTESSVLRDPVAATAHMQRLRSAGVRFSIDDFGTGYSSLSQLKRLPVDEIKIDRSFVLDANAGGDNAVIVKSIIELGHAMGLAVVAEGVETAELWTMLDGLGCDYAQGYFISRPLSAADVWSFIGQINSELAKAFTNTAMVRVLKQSRSGGAAGAK